MKNYLIKQFIKTYEELEPKTYFSPGRVNLIGEHIDYNGGFVMPTALSYGIYGTITKREDTLVKVFSEGFSTNIYEFDLLDIKKDPNNEWADYIKGVYSVMIKRGYKITNGLNLYMYSSMPARSGLSSSAALELLMIYILNDMFNLNISKKDMALIGKDVENNYVGVNSGIMDQFSVVAGKKDNAILLNTSTLEYEYIPMNFGDYQLIVANTNKSRELVDSKYNERFSECMTSLDILKPIYNVEHLCEIDVSKLDEIKELLDETRYKRVRHVITEQNRTIKSKEALFNNEVELFAQYLNESHDSLKNDYDVTGIELDTLVEESIKAGAIGARMTGAGFGGCIVGIVDKELINDLIEEVTINYKNIIGYEPTFYVVNPSDGTKEI